MKPLCGPEIRVQAARERGQGEAAAGVVERRVPERPPAGFSPGREALAPPWKTRVLAAPNSSRPSTAPTRLKAAPSSRSVYTAPSVPPLPASRRTRTAVRNGMVPAGARKVAVVQARQERERGGADLPREIHRRDRVHQATRVDQTGPACGIAPDRRGRTAASRDRTGPRAGRYWIWATSDSTCEKSGFTVPLSVRLLVTPQRAVAPTSGRPPL